MSALDLAIAAPQAPEFRPGEFTSAELSNEDYHSIPALSASGIKRLLQSPMHYRYDKDNPSDATDSLLMGTALHCAILEPHRLDDTIIVIPEDAPKRPTKAQINAKKPSQETLDAIDWWAKFEKAAAGKEVLPRDLFDRVQAMANSVRRHPIYDALIAANDGQTQTEHSMLWRDARLDIDCKCRFDVIRRDGIALDLKTCQDASPEGFARAVASFKYHYQAAWYNTGHEHVRNASVRAWMFIAVESVAPYGCAVYHLEPNAIAYGATRCEEAMLLYAQATKTGYWRGYPETVQRLALPRWATTLSTPL